MKKVLFHLVQLTVILSLLLSLQACGSRGGGSDSSDTGTTTDTTTDGGTTTPAVTVADISISASPAAINPLETSKITVLLLNSTGQPITAAKEITFALSAPALGTITPSVTTSSGSTTQTFTAKGIEGIVTVTATADGKSASQDIQISKTIAASTLTAAANPASITNGATSVVSATVLDGEDNPMPNGTTVNFSVDNSALGTIVSSATTTDGVAKATFSAGTSSMGTANITATSGVATGTATIEVTGTVAGSIEFVSATPQIISIKGTGGQETSEIRFQVNDSSGAPIVTSQSVSLTLSGPNGGEYLEDTPGTTSLTVGTVDGGVTTILHSGTIPGTATLLATVLDGAGNPTSLTTSSGVIAIGGGTPSAGHFSLSADTLNLEGGTNFDLGYDNVQDNVNVLIADRYGNYNVLEGTTVSFYSECGAIDRAVALGDTGAGSVTFRTQIPHPEIVDPDPLGTPIGSGSCGARCDAENAFISNFYNVFGYNIASGPYGSPRQGLCSIIAVVDGEEEFTDNDASGTYDLGEPFVDTYDDIHLDKDDDSEYLEPSDVSPGHPYDPEFEDLVVDRNENTSFDGMNGVWDYNKRVSKKIDLLFTGDPHLTLSTTDINVPNGGSQTIFFALSDYNFNHPIGGTTITASTEGSGTLSGTKTYTYLDSNGLGTPILSVTISDSDPATDEVKPVTLEFSWSWRGNNAVLSVSGITH